MKRHKSFTGQEPLLYLVATPIGNLEEISPRAVRILTEADYIACEDTRVSNKLMQHLSLSKTLISCHEHNENEAASHIIGLIKKGASIAYVSDAGFPGISDPGRLLVRKALDEDIKVSVVSGPSALLNALVASGLDASSFYFRGFLSSKRKIRDGELRDISKRTETIILYEAPHRIKEVISHLYEVLGNREICLARELTKKHEEYIYGTLQEFPDLDFETVKGEIVLVIGGSSDPSSEKADDESIIALVGGFVKEGLSAKEAVRKASLLLKVNKNYVYKLIHKN